MSTITVSDLKKKPAKQWLKSAGRDGLIVTVDGQPVAILLRTDAESAESTLAAFRSLRALQAQVALQEASLANSTDKLSMTDIVAEIASARRARRR